MQKGQRKAQCPVPKMTAAAAMTEVNSGALKSSHPTSRRKPPRGTDMGPNLTQAPKAGDGSFFYPRPQNKSAKGLTYEAI